MAGRDITHGARTTSLVSNRALVKEDAHIDGDEQNSVTESGGVREKGRGAKRVRAELDPVKSSNSSFFFFVFIWDNRHSHIGFAWLMGV